MGGWVGGWVSEWIKLFGLSKLEFKILMAHNWQKLKIVFFACPCHKIYRVEAVKSKNVQYCYTWKIIMFANNYVKFGAISWKIDILSITAWLKFESKSSFAHMWRMLLWLSDAHHISFLLNRFSVRYRFPFPILHFWPQNHLALLKDRFLKKMLLKRAKTDRLFFIKI